MTPFAARPLANSLVVSERVFERANQHDGLFAHWCPLAQCSVHLSLDVSEHQ